VFFGPLTNDENKGLLDLDLREKVIVVAMIVPIVWIGVHPSPLLRRLDASVIELVRTMEARGADVAAVNGGETSSQMAERVALRAERVALRRLDPGAARLARAEAQR
jgi:hypothetical protein